MYAATGLTPSLEVEVEDVEDGDSGEEEGEERSDGEEELEEVLLRGVDSTATTGSLSSSGTLLLRSSSCCDSNNVTSFSTEAGKRQMQSEHIKPVKITFGLQSGVIITFSRQ